MTEPMGGEADRQWFIVSRWQQYEGESRANLLRILAVGSFYLIQLTQFYYWGGGDAAEKTFHRSATALAVAWIVLALLVQLCLTRGVFPPAFKFLTTAFDLVLLTAVATLGAGPTSPLILGYFLIQVVAALRFSLPLVWCTTLGSMLGYLATIGLKDPRWFDADHIVPPVQQLITLLCLGLCGIMLGQVVRRVRSLAWEFARRSSVASR